MKIQVTTIKNPYPIGAIYISLDKTSPATLFGGTWVQIKSRFLLATSQDPSNQTNDAGDVGGVESVTLTAAQSGVPAHTHGMSHTHSHSHIASSYESGKAASGSAQPVPRGKDNGTGNFSTDTDSTASSKSTTNNNTAKNATEAHTNMPPYLKVNMWQRTA